MKKGKENVKQRNFTKATKTGISLIVLVITIIVIVILATAVIVSISNNNPVAEANRARYESDVDNMQAVFTNTVAKIMVQNRATVSVTAGQINTTTSGVKETTGEVSYTVKNAVKSSNSSGTIVFDKGTSTETTYYTGKLLPIYAAGETIWYVDEDGNISLEVAGIQYGNGEIVEVIENALINMYEDLAGDEEGATEGKLHIGDYVNYNPIASGITEKTEDNGYVYVSANSVTGLTEAASDSNYSSAVNGVTEQKFTTQENLKWRVLGIEGDNILITTEEPIMPDNPLTVDGYTGYFMYGAKSYTNGIREIINISKIYGNGDLAESATGMTIDHVNKITGVTVTEDTISPSGVELNTSMGWNAYGSEYSFDAGSSAGWSPESWIAKAEAEAEAAAKGETVTITSPGISGNVNGYVYELANTNLKTAGSTIRYSLIDKTGSSTYYLASRGVFAYSDYALFGPGAVDGGRAASFGGFFGSDGVSGGVAAGVRPVVSLKSNVIGELQSTTDGVSTWKISLN